MAEILSDNWHLSYYRMIRARNPICSKLQWKLTSVGQDGLTQVWIKPSGPAPARLCWIFRECEV